MSKLIALSIDVMKINKTRLIKGKKGTYLNLAVSLNDQKDKFGNDVSCWEGQSEEERKSKTDRNFLGNGRVVYSSEGPKQANPASQDPNDNYTDEERLPF